MGSYISSSEFRKDVKKMSASSDYKYRSKFDPVPSSALKKSDKTRQ